MWFRNALITNLCTCFWLALIMTSAPPIQAVNGDRERQKLAKVTWNRKRRSQQPNNPRRRAEKTSAMGYTRKFSFLLLAIFYCNLINFNLSLCTWYDALLCGRGYARSDPALRILSALYSMPSAYGEETKGKRLGKRYASTDLIKPAFPLFLYAIRVSIAPICLLNIFPRAVLVVATIGGVTRRRSLGVRKRSDGQYGQQTSCRVSRVTSVLVSEARTRITELARMQIMCPERLVQRELILQWLRGTALSFDCLASFPSVCGGEGPGNEAIQVYIGLPSSTATPHTGCVFPK